MPQKALSMPSVGAGGRDRREALGLARAPSILWTQFPWPYRASCLPEPVRTGSTVEKSHGGDYCSISLHTDCTHQFVKTRRKLTNGSASVPHTDGDQGLRVQETEGPQLPSYLD